MKTYEKIKSQMDSAGVRAWSNDNIAPFLREGDKETLINEAEEAFEKVMDALLIDWKTDPNAMETPHRLAKMYYNELFSGRYDAPPKVSAFPNEGDAAYKGMIFVRADIKSMCAHHHQPVTGVAYIAVIPNEKMIGLSKYTRIAQWCARRGTLQEELTKDIADEIQKHTGAESVGVMMGARHGCCENRGIGASMSLTQTAEMRGAFREDPRLREEFYANVQYQATTVPHSH